MKPRAATAAEHAVVAHASLQVVVAQVGTEVVHRSCTAKVWPTEQMS